MKRVFIYLLSFFALVPFASRGQFSISNDIMDVSPMADSVRNLDVKNYSYFSQAREDARRRQLRKERNTLEFNATLQASQTSFDNWSSGGQNTVSTRATVFFQHQYKREKVSFNTKFEGRMGFNYIDKEPFKNEDEFKFSSTMLIPMHEDFSYDGTMNVRSQFALGYDKRGQGRSRQSAFMSPGFVDISLGVNYKPKSVPGLSMTVSPISTNLITVIDDYLSDKGINGVEKGKHTKGQLGPSMRVDYDREFAKKVFRFRSNFSSFTNIKKAPIARWENHLEIRATKHITTTLVGILNYNEDSNVLHPKGIQTNYVISVGLAYRFKNK